MLARMRQTCHRSRVARVGSRYIGGRIRATASELHRRNIMSMEKHVAARSSFPGRWVPAVFYALNVALWFLAGIVFEAWDLLYLVFVTLPALALYVWRTR